ncbi:MULTISPECIES: hypothetical protein [Pectobacterium]|uniref:hypothetical protein n=1 Tax=Pectobacterium TaxID=122277 RepID=UPI0003116B55|nr:hypothetical protein [Pectobacterium carotovorum]
MFGDVVMGMAITEGGGNLYRRKRHKKVSKKKKGDLLFLSLTQSSFLSNLNRRIFFNILLIYKELI